MFMIQSNIAIDGSVSICKTSNTIKLDYMDSFHGISDVKTLVKNDTLFLTIYISRSVKNKTKEIPLPYGINFVHYGKFTKEVNKLIVCPKVLSGKEALGSN